MTSHHQDIATGQGRRMPVEILQVPAKSKKVAVAGSLGIVAAGSAVLFFSDPSVAAFYPPCPFHALTGLYCPGCGTTRALHALLHGNLGEALGLNPLMVLMLPFVGYSLLSYATLGVWGRALPGLPASSLWGWIVFWVILAYWVLRNVPLYPLSLLAP